MKSRRKRERADLPTTKRAKAKPRIGVPRNTRLEAKVKAFLEPPIASSSSGPRNTPAIAAAAPSSSSYDWRDRPAGMPSKNQRARKRGYGVVVSVRLPPAMIDQLDEEVQAQCGSYFAKSRTDLISEAITSYLAELKRQRRNSEEAA